MPADLSWAVEVDGLAADLEGLKSPASVSDSEVTRPLVPGLLSWTWARLPESKLELKVNPATSNTPASAITVL